MSKSAKRKAHDAKKLAASEGGWRAKFKQRVEKALQTIRAGGTKAEYERRCQCENGKCEFNEDHAAGSCSNAADPRKRIMHLGALCSKCYATYPVEDRLEEVLKHDAAIDAEIQRRGHRFEG